MGHSEFVSFLWSIADLIRDTFTRGKHQDVIDRLKELRTALISAAVTGKIDVPEETSA
ncbi:MAG: hypothetical protein HY017_27940 [Betaproteobacteria bacterium]|nr:hypothetical protein [Betaproteobacteria bacterium]